MLDSIDSAELSEWLAFFRIVGTPDPWLMTGTIAAQMHNAWFKGRAMAAEDFRPIPSEPREQSPEQQMAMLDGMARRWKGP